MTDAPDAVPQQSPPAPPPGPAPRAPRKWFGAWGGLWISLGLAVIIALAFLESWLLQGVQQPTPREYDVIDPVLLLIGSGCVIAGFLYTMAYRLEPRWGLSAGRLIGGGLAVGFLAAVAAGMVNGAVDAFTGGTDASPSTAAFAVVGFIEESAKLAAALLLGRSLPVKNARVGLFLGAAVGFGFAVVENLGYLETAWSVGLAHHQPVVGTLATAVARQLLGPFLHPVLTGLATAAVFGASRSGRYRITWGVVGAWLAVAVAHSLFDLGSGASDNLSDPYLGESITAATIVAYLAASFIAWLLISRGLKRRDRAVEDGASLSAPEFSPPESWPKD